LPNVRGEAVDRFFAQLAAKKLSPKSRKNVRATLRRILASAVEWGYLDALPTLPKIKVPDAPWDFFTGTESARLLAAARNPEERLLFMFALHTGARAGEQLAVEWGDVDFRSNLVVLRRSSTRGVVGHTKSGREAKVPLTASLGAALKAHRHIRGKLVFCNPDGSPLSLWQLHERLEMVCRLAGLRRIRWHDLRHSFASQLAAKGVPLRQIQAWLNHSTIHMSMHYAHLAPDADAELISVLDQAQHDQHTPRGSGVATK
jgi:integrase